MPLLSFLNEKEGRSLIHRVRQRQNDDNGLEQIATHAAEKNLAKLSEEANFELKNHHRHEKITLAHADKPRLAVDKTKVRDLMKH